MESDYGKQVVCMIKADGNKEAFVVVANEGCTVNDIIRRLINGEKNMSPYESGCLVTGEWRDKLLHEYWDTMENEYEPGGWEYPGIYVSGTRKIPRFSKNAYLPHYILGRWYGDANEIFS